MSHEITQTKTEEGKSAFECAFLEGSRVWHDSETKPIYFPAGTTDWREVRAAAHMLYDIEETPVMYCIGGVMYKSDSHKINYRAHDKAQVGIVGIDYQTDSIQSFSDLMQKICDEHGLIPDALFSMRGGSRLVMQAKIPNSDLEIVPGDTTQLYLSLATAFDGSLTRIGWIDDIRKVCANTMRQSLSQEGKHKRNVKSSHKSEFDPASIAEALGYGLEAHAHQVETYKQLQAVTLDTKQAAAILADIFGKPLAKREKDKLGQIPLSKPESKILDLFGGEAIGFDLVGQTAWGLLNSVTEWTDHHYGRTDDARLNSQMFGPNASLKAKALETVSSILTTDYMAQVDEQAKAFN